MIPVLFVWKTMWVYNCVYVLAIMERIIIVITIGRDYALLHHQPNFLRHYVTLQKYNIFKRQLHFFSLLCTLFITLDKE